jgi:NTP pyrophosphatase (non-canonical NTP hydrolase)
MSHLETVIEKLIQSRIPHRRGYILADMTLKEIWQRLLDEVMELGDEIELGETEKSKDELGDVHSIVIHLTQRLGTNVEKMEVASEQKLYQRFPGLKAEVPVPDDGPRLW